MTKMSEHTFLEIWRQNESNAVYAGYVKSSHVKKIEGGYKLTFETVEDHEISMLLPPSAIIVRTRVNEDAIVNGSDGE